MDNNVNGNVYPDHSLIEHATLETDNNIPRTELFDSIIALDQTDQLDQFPDHIQPTSLAVDIINQCNLTCEHCFWVKQKDSIPVTRNNKILDSVRQAIKKYPSINNILWYGGEPLMAKRLLLEGFKILGKNNTVITNGTIPLPNWHAQYNVHFGVSIDGTELLHNQIRGERSYQKTKKNILNALQKEIPIYILYCINSKNINDIDFFLKEWGNENINKIVFTIYVPEYNDISGLELSNQQMRIVSNKLKFLKDKYPIIDNSNLMLELIKPEYGYLFEEYCPMNINHASKKYSVRGSCIHLLNNGKLRTPCSFGSKANCNKCRSVTMVALYSATKLGDGDALRGLFNACHPRLNKLKG